MYINNKKSHLHDFKIVYFIHMSYNMKWNHYNTLPILIWNMSDDALNRFSTLNNNVQTCSTNKIWFLS